MTAPELLDEAERDPAVSGDAMRWRPDPPQPVALTITAAVDPGWALLLDAVKALAGAPGPDAVMSDPPRKYTVKVYRHGVLVFDGYVGQDDELDIRHELGKAARVSLRATEAFAAAHPSRQDGAP